MSGKRATDAAPAMGLAAVEVPAMEVPAIEMPVIDLPAAGPGDALRRCPSVLASFRAAGDGLRWALGSQRNLRVHTAAAVLVLATAPSLALSAVEIAMLIGAIAAVVAAELFNTAAESLVDLVCPQYHPLAKVVKDVSAAGVLICAAGAAAIGSVILWPHLRLLF